MNSCSSTLIKDAHHTAPSCNEAFAASVVRVMTIIHTASFHCLVVCLAAHTWDLQKGKAIVFNHPQGRGLPWKSCACDQWLMQTCKMLHPGITHITSLSSTSDTSFHVCMRWDELAEWYKITSSVIGNIIKNGINSLTMIKYPHNIFAATGTCQIMTVITHFTPRSLIQKCDVRPVR